MMNEGLYFASILEFGVGMPRKANSHPQVWLDIEVGQENVGTLDEPQWRPIEASKERIYWSLHPNAYDFTVSKMERLGWNGDFGGGMGFEHRNGVVQCTHEEYQGKTKIKWDLPGTGTGKSEPPDPATIRKLNAQYQAKKRASGVTGAAPTSVQAQPVQEPPPLSAADDGPPGPSDDESPF